DFFSDALKASGVHGVDTQREVYRLAAGVSERRFEDIYESARIAAAGLGNVKEGLAIAKTVGQPGEQVDIGKLISNVRDNLTYIGPELQQAGISNADLLRFFSNPEAEPDLAGRINSIVAARKSVASNQGLGYRAQQGAAGGIATYEPEQAPSY